MPLPLILPLLGIGAGYMAGSVKRRFKRRVHDPRTAVTARMRAIDPRTAVTRRMVRVNPAARRVHYHGFTYILSFYHGQVTGAHYAAAIYRGKTNEWKHVYDLGLPNGIRDRKAAHAFVKSWIDEHRYHTSAEINRSNPRRMPVPVSTAAARVAQWRWHRNPGKLLQGTLGGVRYSVKKKPSTGEWMVAAHVNGKFNDDKTSYHDEKDDAVNTFRYIMANHGGTILSNPRRKRNPETEARELALFAVNDGTLYRQRAQPIMANLRKKIRSGKYDATKALKLWAYLADAAAQAYTKESGAGGVNGSYGIFSKADRAMAAKEIAEHYDEELKGDITKTNPARRRKVDGDLKSAFAFFKAHAGGIVGEASKGALQLAKAERIAANRGWRWEWRSDDEMSQEDGAQRYLCILNDAKGEVLGSLGGIDVDSGPYKRVVEAELALEALSGRRNPIRHRRLRRLCRNPRHRR